MRCNVDFRNLDIKSQLKYLMEDEWKCMLQFVVSAWNKRTKEIYYSVDT